jgi:hypothetical protein
MCLLIWIEAEAADRASLVTAAHAASEFGLQVDVARASRWPWARSKPVRATISEGGGCACGMLSDDAAWNAETSAMRADIVEPLARTLETLLSLGPGRLTVAALWVGERPQQQLDVTPAELTRLVRTTGLRTKTRYVVNRGAA